MAPHSHGSLERGSTCLDYSMQKVEGGLLEITDSLLSPASQSFYAYSVLVCFTELCWLNDLYGQYFSVLVTVMQDVRSESAGLQCVCIPPQVDSTFPPSWVLHFLEEEGPDNFVLTNPKIQLRPEPLTWWRHCRVIALFEITSHSITRH